MAEIESTQPGNALSTLTEIDRMMQQSEENIQAMVAAIRAAVRVCDDAVAKVVLAACDDIELNAFDAMNTTNALAERLGANYKAA